MLSWSSPVPSCLPGILLLPRVTQPLTNKPSAEQHGVLEQARDHFPAPHRSGVTLAVVQQLLCEQEDGKHRSCAFPFRLDGNQSGFSRGWKVQGLLLATFSAAALCSATASINLEGISPHH